MREHGAMMQVVTLRPGAVELQPVPSLPPIHLAHEGVFMGSPDWWRRFEYLNDRNEGNAFQEDIWTPGVVEMHLEPGKTAHLVIGVGALPEGAPADLVRETREELLTQDANQSRSATGRVLDRRRAILPEPLRAAAHHRGLSLAHHLHARPRDVGDRPAPGSRALR